MRTQNHTIGQRLMAYILLFSLFLQNCTNPSLSLAPNKQGATGNDQLEASIPMESFLEARETPTDPKKPANQKEELNDGLVSSLQGAPSTADQSDKPKTLSFPTDQQAKTKNLQPTHLSPGKSSPKLIRDKSTVNGLQGHKRLVERQQVESSSEVQKAFHPTKQADKEVPVTEVPITLQPSTPPNTPLVTKGRFQIAFQKTATGQWKALVNESFQVGISRKVELPVCFELGYNITHAANSHLVHIIHQATDSFIWVGSVGIKGGMYQEEGDNNNKRNRNRSSSKATIVPSELSDNLKYLYQQDDTLPKLIEYDDITAQSIQGYYVKLQVVLQEDIVQERSASARDQVVGEKKTLEVDKLFDEIDKDHPAVGRILLLGSAGIGKSTLMHYIAYQWAHGNLWKYKYEHVFRVRLKDLLDPTWSKKADKPDLLARFIYSCLDKQKTALAVKGHERLEKMGYDLGEIQQLLKDPSKKEKVLLLVDGYDEITSLKGKPEYQKIVDLGIFKHPKVIMTSRPNAASKEIRAKFDRQVESQGLDEAGINQYISLQFKQEPALGEKLKEFLFSNSQVKNMCEVPVNMALLSITWKDKNIRDKFANSKSMRTDFKLGQLYQELIVWLGKRYVQRYKVEYSSPQSLRELSNKAVLGDRVFQALERIAYKAFTGQLGDRSQASGVLGIPGESIDELAKEVDKELTISELHKYGLLRGEGNPNNPLAQTYYFIHLTFQEYLTARHLCKLLSQEDQVKGAATWLAHHRNEPKYLTTFKFLAELVRQSKDERLVRSFWEAMSCNVDGVIELGVEGKVKLLMHLLSQSKIQGQFDKRIPYLKQIEELIDGTLQEDLVKWQQAIIETGYFPTWLQEAAIKGLEEEIGLARKASLSERDRPKLQVAIELVSNMASNGVIDQELVLKELAKLMELPDWRLQRLGLEKAREVIDQTISKKLLKENIALAAALFGDKNSEAAAAELLVKMAAIDAQLVFKHLKPLLAHKDESVRDSAADALLKIVQLMPSEERIKALKPLLDDGDGHVRSSVMKGLRAIVQLMPGRKGFEALLPLLADKNYEVRRSAADALGSIVELVPELRKEGFEALKPLLADSNEYVRSKAAEALRYIVKLVPGLGKEGFEALKRLLTDSREDIRKSAADVLPKIVQLLPQLGKEGFDALKPLLADKDESVRRSAAEALVAIVELVPELGKKGFEALKPLLTDSHEDVRKSATKALPKIIELAELARKLKKEGFNALKPLLADGDPSVRSRATDALKKIIKLAPELAKERFQALRPLLADTNGHVRQNTVNALIAIVQLMPELGKEAFNALKPLLADNFADVRSSVVNTLVGIMESVPELRKEVFQALKPLLDDNYTNVRSGAAEALVAIVRLVPDLGKEGFDALKPLLASQSYYVRSRATQALRAMVELVPELIKKGFETFKLLLGDEHEEVRNMAADALVAMVKLMPELGKEGFEALNTLLASKDYNVRSKAIRVLIAIVELIPGLRKEGFETLKPLLADEHEEVRSSAAYALGVIVRLVPELEKEGLQLLKPLLTDSYPVSRSITANTLVAILKLVPELGKEGFEALKPLLGSRDYNVQSRAFSALEAIVGLVPFSEQVSLLADASPTIRETVKKALIAKFKLAERIGYQSLSSLMKLLVVYQGAQEELDKALYQGAMQALTHLADHLDSEGLAWINSHLNELSNLPATQTFLKAVMHATLQDRMIDLQEAALLIKCMVARGLTATIYPQKNQIILDDNTYALKDDSQANLTHVVNEVIRLSKDPIAQQYKLHQPLFKNSGEGLPVATADIEKAVSMLDKTPLDADSWHVSVVDLSDNHQNEPSTTFILLEQRNYAGQHVIHQLKLDKGEGKVSSYAMNPLAVDDGMKQKIFGELYLMKKPRCYVYSFTLSQKLGEELITAASQMKGMEDSYSTLHKLAVDYQAMQVNPENTPSDLLSLPWEAYSKNLGVKTYEKEEVYGKAMGSVGINVHFNIGNVEKINVEKVENLKAENIEELKIKNAKNVNANNLIN